MKKIGLLIAVSILTGCATSKLDYIPPVHSQFNNTATINEDFEVVWDRLVKNLASDFFVINNIEKSSRIINVSFSSTKPERYVNCGKSIREFSNARGKQRYEYDPSESSRYTTTNDMGHMFNAVRSTNLDGRANIYVAPSDSGTLLTVNAKYIVEGKVNYYNHANQPAGVDEFTFDFSTKTPYEEPSPIGTLTCFAKGNLEQKVIDYAL